MHEEHSTVDRIQFHNHFHTIFLKRPAKNMDVKNGSSERKLVKFHASEVPADK